MEEKKDKCKCEDCTCEEECTCEECECENCECEECTCDECSCGEECACEDDLVKTLENKIEELEKKVLTGQADMINYRRRKDEEVQRMLKYCNEDMVTDLLQTIDNFERAIKMDTKDLTDELSKFLEGFKMIYCNLVNVLNKYDVKAIDGANKPFDPTYHQAVLTEHDDNMESGMVIEVLQKGYLLKDKVIRPAMVKVSE